MSAWYQAKITYHSIDNKGKVLKTNEAYLVNAVSHTDAETKVYEHVSASIPPDFKLARLSPFKVQEIFNIENGAETWYKVKVNFIAFDEKSQKEKRTSFLMLVNADNPEIAYNLVSERLGTVEDYQITNVDLTNILEIIN